MSCQAVKILPDSSDKFNKIGTGSQRYLVPLVDANPVEIAGIVVILGAVNFAYLIKIVLVLAVGRIGAGAGVEICFGGISGRVGLADLAKAGKLPDRPRSSAMSGGVQPASEGELPRRPEPIRGVEGLERRRVVDLGDR